MTSLLFKLAPIMNGVKHPFNAKKLNPIQHGRDEANCLKNVLNSKECPHKKTKHYLFLRSLFTR